MTKIRVERLYEGTNEMEEYEVVTMEEALKAIDNFNIAETLVDYARSQLGCIIQIDLKTGDIVTKLNDDSFRPNDNTTIRFVADIDAYYDLDSLSQIVVEYDDFNEFEEQYENWENDIERKYDFEFNEDKYGDVYEAYVVEVLKKDSEAFHRAEIIDTMEGNIDCDIYEDTRRFYDELR
ncbi:hypothetical protein [Clostridium estertheticum]|uniref:Uncharacterized protein n=1 Tax=Clostridium estertheticum TaxID=238834 RepID=A0A7Y3T006_9CLOT|nr:hypothetical protein [Clostridium estertheticum]NNU78153.1 hypothetical protein [Clostridium estertheticum]WBL47735.1 hypothetical protein LOR37_03330 [Clostridium estertheticum]